MDQTNLDTYGHPPIPWSRAEHQLGVEGGQSATHFLATVLKKDLYWKIRTTG